MFGRSIRHTSPPSSCRNRTTYPSPSWSQITITESPYGTGEHDHTGTQLKVPTCFAHTAYPHAASKHAMVGMTRSLAVEIARTPVTVNAVCPGWVRTQMTERAADRIAEKTGRGREEAERALVAMSPQRRLVLPEEVAHVVAMLCAEEARSIHGQAIPIDGGQVMS